MQSWRMKRHESTSDELKWSVSTRVEAIFQCHKLAARRSPQRLVLTLITLFASSGLALAYPGGCLRFMGSGGEACVKVLAKSMLAVENVSLVSSVGPSVLFALIVALDAPLLPATVYEKHQC